MATSWRVLEILPVNIMVLGAQTPKCHFVKVNNNLTLIIEDKFKI